MADVIAELERQRADVLTRLGQAADQKAAWTQEHESLVQQARALDIAQDDIAAHAQVDQSTVSRMLARSDPTGNGSADVGRASAET
jgi:DNA-binding MarR family transcriptional regulator